MLQTVAEALPAPVIFKLSQKTDEAVHQLFDIREERLTSVKTSIIAGVH